MVPGVEAGRWCQFDVSAGFAFGPGCGLKLVAAAPAPIPGADADRLDATVLFADLSGYTPISERLDPKDVRRLQIERSARCTASSTASMHILRS